MSSVIQQGTPTDEDLLRAMLEGDEEAFATLYRRWQGGVYRFSLQMSGSHAIAEDVVQEVFLTLMRQGHRYDNRRGGLAAYLYGIARKKLARARRGPVDSIDERGEYPSKGEGPAVAIERAEEIQSVRQAVLSLPRHYREAVVLCDLEEMSYEEAAQALGCAVGTIRSRLHRGRELLARRLRSREPGSLRSAGLQRLRSWSL